VEPHVPARGLDAGSLARDNRAPKIGPAPAGLPTRCRRPRGRRAGGGSRAFAVDKVGQWSDGPEFKVEAERARAYAAATNDPIAAHRDGAVAPPVFAIVPIWDTMAGAMAGVTPPEVLLLVVHGEQDMIFHKAITPGMVLRSKAAPIGVHVKPNGTSVVVRYETRDPGGDLVVEQYIPPFPRRLRRRERRRRRPVAQLSER